MSNHPRGPSQVSEACLTALPIGPPISNTTARFLNSEATFFPSAEPIIHENSSLFATFDADEASRIRHHLNTVQANAEYHFGNRYSATVGVFSTTGTPDTSLFPAAAVNGSANGDPRSTGYMANLSWWPVQNIDLAFQYTGYSRFNGAGTNYDGSGRSASANNTVYLVARFVF